MKVDEHAIRAAVHDRRDELVLLTCALIGEQSTVGNEEGAQRIVSEWLENDGFKVARVQPDADAALADPYAGYPALSYEGRSSVVGTRVGSGGGRSLHLSGHVDVVPVDPAEAWVRDPWTGYVSDGRVWGRGAGDMRGVLRRIFSRRP